jgi:agmatine deiminase
MKTDSATPLRLPAEWETQDGVLVCWPHRDSLWAPMLERAEPAFAAIVREISQDETVLLIARGDTDARRKLERAGARLDRIRFYDLATNDTWTRDYGPITVLERGRPVLLDFEFNGWGRKYTAAEDNQATRRLHASGAWGRTPLRAVRLILEGGSIDSDGQGTLLTTRSCLTETNRNPGLSRTVVAERLCAALGLKRVLWLEHGMLEGDDTDGHVDTLARFAAPDTIVFTACDDPRDAHYAGLQAMAAELRAFRRADGQPYRLIPLPWPAPCYDSRGQRLPATYANFLIANAAVLVPAYGGQRDAEAGAVLARLFPGRRVVAIDCSVMIVQHGAVHCSTMQIPRGVLP